MFCSSMKLTVIFVLIGVVCVSFITALDQAEIKTKDHLASSEGSDSPSQEQSVRSAARVKGTLRDVGNSSTPSNRDFEGKFPSKNGTDSMLEGSQNGTNSRRSNGTKRAGRRHQSGGWLGVVAQDGRGVNGGNVGRGQGGNVEVDNNSNNVVQNGVEKGQGNQGSNNEQSGGGGQDKKGQGLMDDDPPKGRAVGGGQDQGVYGEKGGSRGQGSDGQVQGSTGGQGKSAGSADAGTGAHASGQGGQGGSGGRTGGGSTGGRRVGGGGRRRG